MSFIKNMLKGNVNIRGVTTAKTKEVKDDDEWATADLFEGGHRLSALDNIGSSLTTLWSNCALNKPESTTSEDDKTRKHRRFYASQKHNVPPFHNFLSLNHFIAFSEIPAQLQAYVHAEMS